MKDSSQDHSKVACLGEILIDLFPSELGKKLADVPAFIPKPGGAPANVAVAVAKLGVPSAFIGKVGDDAFGHFLIQTLLEQGVNTRGMRVDNYARTTLAFIAKPDENTAEFIFYRNPGADLRLEIKELDTKLLAQVRALHIGSLSLTDEPALSTTLEAIHYALRGSAFISFDVNYRPSLWSTPEEAIRRIETVLPLANLLKVNETELRLLSRNEIKDETNPLAACQILLEKGPELIAVTLGQKGSYFCTRTTHGFVPAFQVDTVDAVGCGDAFVAGLLVRMVQSSDWRERLTLEMLREDFRYANAVGAITAMAQGVIPALPTADRVQEFLAQPPLSAA